MPRRADRRDAGETDLRRLRDVGWSDEEIVDIVHQTAFFNYMTRVAGGLGIEPEQSMLDAEEGDLTAVDTSTRGERRQT